MSGNNKGVETIGHAFYQSRWNGGFYMIKDYLNAKTIQVIDSESLNGWESAVHKASEPLLALNKIDAAYVEAIIKEIDTVGPYMNIGPQICLAHAPANPDSVHEVALSLMKTTQSIDLVNEKHPVTLWFVLASPDATSHLQLLQQLTKILMNVKVLENIKQAKTIDEITKIISEQEKVGE